MTVSTMAVSMTIVLLMTVPMTICFLVGVSMHIPVRMAVVELKFLFLALCCLHWFDLPTPVTVAVTNVSKEQHSNLHQFNVCFFFQSGPYQVDCQADRANNEDQLYIFDLLHLHEPLHRIDKDGEAESDKEDGIDQSSNHLFDNFIS